MSTTSRKHIETEKRYYEEAVTERLAELGKEEPQAKSNLRDARLRHLKAKVRQSDKRLRAISNAEKLTEDLARRKEEKLERKRAGLETPKKPAQKTGEAKKKKKEKKEKKEKPQEPVRDQDEEKEED